MKNKISKAINYLLFDSLLMGFVSYTVLGFIFVALFLISLADLPLEAVAKVAAALGGVFGTLGTLMLWQLKKSSEFWKMHEEVEEKVNAAVTKEELNDIYANDFQVLINKHMGGAHSVALQRLYAIMTTKVQYLK